MRYLNDYVELHKKKAFVGKTILKYEQQLRFLIGKHNIKNILDYGCGQAFGWNNGFLHEIKHVALYDPAVERYSQIPVGKFDMVICCDVVEHVPEDELDELFKNLFSYAQKCLFLTFCNRPARSKRLLNGENVHISQHEREYWLEKIYKYNTNKIDFLLIETE